MSLHDEHLQQALRHAPDSEQMPDAATRNAVLAYADHVLKSHQKTWLSRLTDGLHEWHISSWQPASMGSVVVAVLVVAVFWHERPDETIWIASAPTGTVASLDSQRAADAILGKQLSDNSVVAAAQESAKDSQKDKAQPMPPAASAESTKVASADAVADKVGQLEQRSELPAFVASPVVEKDKIAAANAPEAMSPSVNTNATLRGAVVAESTVKNESDVAREHLARKPAPKVTARTAPLLPTDTAAIGAALPAEHDGNRALAIAISKEGGKVLANKDISTGVFRHIYLGKYFLAKSPSECEQLQSDLPLADDVTGYRIEFISGCHATERLIKEVELYNQAMREWHAGNGQ